MDYIVAGICLICLWVVLTFLQYALKKGTRAHKWRGLSNPLPLLAGLACIEWVALVRRSVVLAPHPVIFAIHLCFVVPLLLALPLQLISGFMLYGVFPRKPHGKNVTVPREYQFTQDMRPAQTKGIAKLKTGGNQNRRLALAHQLHRWLARYFKWLALATFFTGLLYLAAGLDVVTLQ